MTYSRICYSSSSPDLLSTSNPTTVRQEIVEPPDSLKDLISIVNLNTNHAELSVFPVVKVHSSPSASDHVIHPRVCYSSYSASYS